MSESAARQRAAINLDEFERRLRVPERPARDEDPLAELARLVGASDDPFKDIFAANNAGAAAFAVPPRAPHDQAVQYQIEPQAEPNAEQHAGQYPEAAPAILRNVAGQMRHGEYTPAHTQLQAASAAPSVEPPMDRQPMDRQPAPAEPAQFSMGLSRGGVPAPRSAPQSEWQDVSQIAGQDDAHTDSYDGSAPAQESHSAAYAPASMPPATMPSFGMPPSGMPPFIAAQNVPPPPRRQASVGSRKNVMLMGGALCVLVLGIGATLATKGSMHSANKTTPTIFASKEPLKVKPEAGETSANPEGANPRAVRNISLLDRGAEKPKSSRVVSHEEQPVDLRQVPPAPRATNRAGDPDIDRKINLSDSNATRPLASVAGQTRAPSGNGYFPEPRKVRTVMVRPDGTIISPPAAVASAPAKPSPAKPSPAKPSSASPSIAMMATGTTAAPAEPVAPTPPEVRAPEPRQRVAEPAVQPPPRPAPRATNRATQPPPRPQRTAALELQGATRAATPPATATPASAKGGYAVQLAAPGSESEARSVVNRMRQRYAGELGGHSPSIVKANVGTRTVYRVRVTGMSRDAATAMCSKLQGKGGACFVARN